MCCNLLLALKLRWCRAYGALSLWGGICPRVARRWRAASPGVTYGVAPTALARRTKKLSFYGMAVEVFKDCCSDEWASQNENACCCLEARGTKCPTDITTGDWARKGEGTRGGQPSKIGARRARHFPLCNILITNGFTKKSFSKNKKLSDSSTDNTDILMHNA